MRNIPKEHQIYRHFKGNLYQIVTMARDSETQEEMVVYRPVYNDTGAWVRPLSMFLSEVDREKYPDAGQKYRFTLMDRGRAIEEEESGIESSADTKAVEKSSAGVSEKTPGKTSEKSEETAKESAVKESETAEKDTDKISAEKTETNRCEDALTGGLDPLLEQFLDAESYEEKLNVFYLMKKRGTVDMLRYVALSLDTEVTGSDFDEMYSQLLSTLKTFEKFECNRLRP